MFFSENWHFSNTQEHARELRPEMGALSYIFVCRHASASEKDVMKVVPFFCFKQHYKIRRFALSQQHYALTKQNSSWRTQK